jgi:hypothetical protein
MCSDEAMKSANEGQSVVCLEASSEHGAAKTAPDSPASVASHESDAIEDTDACAASSSFPAACETKVTEAAPEASPAVPPTPLAGSASKKRSSLDDEECTDSTKRVKVILATSC